MKLFKLLLEILPHNNTYQIYCDMDGVLTDFDSMFLSLVPDFRGNPQDYESKFGTKQFWNIISAAGVDFWKNMNWMNGGKVLWDYIRPFNPIIITAPSMDKQCIIGKKMWCARELGNVNIIFEKNKYKYAKENRILIDDYSEKIKPWINAGGIGILHRNTKSTIHELDKILKMGS